ncbi:glycoside hydrolase family 2 protein [Neobacillus thermocopriae]|uniref:glycoside hydrolase family 2 protein n=1 Tax=Neobacillus thermocopriae TaxID=1215031 RepID=UPI002E1E1898|nr:sugar-binding domain-containing protein [Neobacillus thermocopriae]MED3622614.1 glycoside hydrolase family 2 TIM barrel-domain containing protein [Neobacillus thermocopriae]MED3714295.1 glycoside hydrolase family 2 TIM barrel-domain containing protein [Neobacillus thermocopriae]
MKNVSIPRNEYPRPQLVRKNWLNLNGEWQFAFDDENIGVKEKWFQIVHPFKQKIIVPFAYQTKLSGINDPSFHDHVWYRREFTVPKEWSGQKIILHFGAVDYRAWVYVNGQYAGYHEGGHVSFSFDITELLTWETETIVVRVEDPSRDETIPRGKQFWFEKSDSIWYTRTTGIWQTVWLEPVSSTNISKLRLTPDIDRGDIIVEFEVKGNYLNKKAEIEIGFKGEKVVLDTIEIFEAYNKRSINLYNRQIFRTSFHHVGWNWAPESPNLFDIKITLKDDQEVLDEIDSYFGMRKIHIENGMVYLNNKPYYQKLVLDQGYWPDGLLTAPTDEDLKKDIELALEMGFNGCRKHQKVEDPRFLYWADKLGFLVWGECPASPSYSEDAASRLTKEWIEIIERDYNHPSIVAWVPLNESWGVPFIKFNKQQQHHSLAMYHLIHSLDPTRLVISNDGWELTVTDICAIHNYNHGSSDEKEKYEAFKESLATKENLLRSKPANRGIYADGFEHNGEPILLTEFGGIGFKVGENNGWGYTSVKDEQEFIADYRRVMEAVYASQALHGYCYTQLTDVEQEINGLLTYHREPKCELEKIREINEMWHPNVVKF